MKNEMKRMTRRMPLWSVGFLSLVAAAAGCGRADPVDNEDMVAVGVSSNGLYYLSTATWQTRPVPVCWTSTPATAGDQQVVRSAIEQSWPQLGNLTFSGWGTCPASFTGIALTPGINNVVSGDTAAVSSS